MGNMQHTMSSGNFIYVFAVLVVFTCAWGLTSGSSLSCGVSDIVDPAMTNQHVLFFEDFENESYGRHFTDSSHPQNRKLVTGNQVFAGDRSLRFTIREGDHYGGSLSFRFAKAGLPEPEELYGRYYLRFGENWEPGHGGKLPGPAGTYNMAGWGGRKVNGTDGWSARMGFTASRICAGETQIYFYTYHVDMRRRYGSNFLWDIENRGSLQKDRWYCIETYVKMNTPQKKDGILRGWVNGQLAMEKTDLRFRYVPKLKVEQFWMNLYYGGTWVAPHDMHVYFDNVALSTRRVGPMP